MIYAICLFAFILGGLLLPVAIDVMEYIIEYEYEKSVRLDKEDAE